MRQSLPRACQSEVRGHVVQQLQIPSTFSRGIDYALIVSLGTALETLLCFGSTRSRHLSGAHPNNCTAETSYLIIYVICVFSGEVVISCLCTTRMESHVPGLLKPTGVQILPASSPGRTWYICVPLTALLCPVSGCTIQEVRCPRTCAQSLRHHGASTHNGLIFGMFAVFSALHAET
jgi:hypothetical protein